MRFRSFAVPVVGAMLVGCAADTSEGEDGESSESALNGAGPKGQTPAAGTTIDCTVLVAGGGTGGVAAALAATRLGIKACITEETDWVGGQLTAQGLNASDDAPGPLTDTVGATRSFLEHRSLMRAAYGGRRNPGGCWVSKLCGEPKVALDALEKMMSPAIDRGLLRVFCKVKLSDYYVKNSKRAREWSDSGGIGFYPMDMHRNVGPTYAPAFPHGHSLPFQIPIGSLIPESLNGLVAGAKNFGTTHLTNSAYRLHPIEWAAGEAAGTLAALCANWNKEPRDAFANEGNLRELQDHLLKGGAPLYWIDDVERTDPKWRDIQLVAATGIMGGPEASTLHFRPELTLTRAQASAALVKALGIAPIIPANASFSDVPKSHWAYSAIEALAAKRIVLGTGEGTFSPTATVTSAQMRAILARSMGDAAAAKAVPATSDAGMSLGAAASALAAAYRIRLYLP